MEKIAPHDPTNQYRHNDTGEDNAGAHIKQYVIQSATGAIPGKFQGRENLKPAILRLYTVLPGEHQRRIPNASNTLSKLERQPYAARPW